MGTRREPPAPWLAGVFALLACLAVIAATPAESTWIVDNGNRALVAQQLLDSGYTDISLGHPAAALDPDGLVFPGAGFVVPIDDGHLSVFPVALPALAAPFLAALGPDGLRVPAALGAAASAWLFAAWLLPAIGRRQAWFAGVLLVLGSPLFFYAVTIWDHSLTVAASLAAWRAMTRPGRTAALWAGAVLGISCWLREEMVWMVAALAVSAYAVHRRRADVVALALAAGVPLLGLALFNAWIFGNPLGIHVVANLDMHEGAVRNLASVSRQLSGVLAGYGESGLESAGLAAAMLAAIALGWLGSRVGGAARAGLFAATCLGLAAWGLGFWRMTQAVSPFGALVGMNGLLVQVPVSCLVGAGMAQLFRLPAAAPLRVGVLAGLLFLLLAVGSGIATQPHFGFGVHWGPRLLLPGVPALFALFWLLYTPDRDAWRFAWGALAAAGLLSTGLSVWFLSEQKNEGARLQSFLLERPADALVTTHPYLVQQLPALWRERQVALVDRPESLQRVVRAVASRRGREGEIQLVLLPGQAALAQIPGGRCVLERSHRGERLHYLDLDIYRCFITVRGRGRPGTSRG